MKMQFTIMLLLTGVSFSIFTGCKKDGRIDTTITETFTSKNNLTYSGTFIATGGFNSSGTNVMDVRLTKDSSFCTDVFITPNGTFTMLLNCSRPNMTGHWNLVSGTGEYTSLHGCGPLTMKFPPNVPTGVVLIETMTGEISR